MWIWILVSLLGLAGLLVLLLSVPIDLAFSFEKKEGFRPRVRIGWLFGLIRKDLGSRKRRPKEPKPKKRSTRRGPQRFFAMLKTRGFPGSFLKLGRRLLSTVKVRELKIDLRLGLGDPAETGLLFGAMAPLLAYAGSVTFADIAVEPDFLEDTLQGYGKGAVRVYPITLVPPLIMFALSPATIRGFMALRRAGRR